MLMAIVEQTAPSRAYTAKGVRVVRRDGYIRFQNSFYVAYELCHRAGDPVYVELTKGWLCVMTPGAILERRRCGVTYICRAYLASKVRLDSLVTSGNTTRALRRTPASVWKTPEGPDVLGP
jgi:hypothetical protein